MDALDLLFRRIVLAARAAGALERPLTVGELLDAFAPYAAARRDGALDTHEDYLHAMMRLASGERARFFGDDLMQDDLKAELAEPNPDLTVLRTYSQTSLRVSTAGIQEVLEGDTAIDLRPPTPLAPPAAAARGTPLATPAAAGGTGPVASTPPDAGAEPRSAGALQEAAAADAAMPQGGTGDRGCPYCAQALPAGRTVKFCPACGLNLLVRRCPGCSAEIDSGWKFCATCGRKA